MFNEYTQFLSVLNKHNVEFLITGGCAVSFYSQTPRRATSDIDVLIKSTPGNEVAVQGAMAELGIKRRKWPPGYFTKVGTFYRAERPVKADIRPIRDVEFNNAWKKRVPATIDLSGNVTVNFISLEDLTASKIAANRPKDRDDLQALGMTASRPWQQPRLSGMQQASQHL